jgi:ubiquinone/menaquinone biosynthesis C-methylase UbiE
MHPFEELIRNRKLLCPETRSAVQLREGHVVSSKTGRDFGPVVGPLNFLKEYEDTLEPSEVPASDINRLRTQLDLPATAEVNADIAKAISATGARFQSAHLSAEARILAERFRMPAFEVGATVAPAPTTVGRFMSALSRAFAPEARSDYRLEAISHSIGERLTTGQEVWRSVRVRNAGSRVLTVAGSKVAKVEVRWATSDGRPLPAYAIATNIPVDLEPGREISLILRIKPPADPGAYMLSAHLLVAGEREVAPFLTAPVQAISVELPVFEYAYYPELLEYGADHHIANLEAVAFLRERYPNRPALILEIGGGVHPMGHLIAGEGHRVVASDISHSQSILGGLYFRIKCPALAQSLAFISCDGMDLPFGDQAFDGVMLFAAFHHFADPIALLREIKRVTRPDGFVILSCETCAPHPSDLQYLEELRRGINEQMWTLAEFTGFFRTTGLQVIRARIDGHSLKACLLKS